MPCVKEKVSIPPELAESAKERAAELGGSLSSYIEALLRADQARPIDGLGALVAKATCGRAERKAASARATIGAARARRKRTRKT